MSRRVAFIVIEGGLIMMIFLRLLFSIFFFVCFLSAVFAQQEAGRPIKETKAFVIDFREPFQELIVDIDENHFIESDNLILPIGSTTQIINNKKKIIDKRVIRPGMQIEITGDRFFSGTFSISKIKVLTDLEKWDFDIQGYFEALDGDKATIDGQVVKLLSGAMIRGKDALKGRTYTSFNEMQLGMQVKIDGTRRSDGMIYAKGGEAELNEFGGGDKRMLDLVRAGMLMPAKLEGGKGKVAGREVIFANDLLLQQYVNKIGNRLVPRYMKDMPADYPGKIIFRFAVIEDESFNAFALPDGSIFIHTGLLKKMHNEAQLAAVIGHEIAHVTHEHGRKLLEGAEKRQWLSLGAILGGAVLGSKEISAAGVVAVGALQNHYGRKEEDQADRVGLYYMTEAGYDPREAPKVWREIAKNTKQDAVSTFLYSNHSMARTRAKHLNREIANNYFQTDFTSTKIGAEDYKKNVGPYFGWIARPAAVAAPATIAPTKAPKGKSIKRGTSKKRR